jgi:hypothetical protein
MAAQRKAVHLASRRVVKHATAARAQLYALKAARDDLEQAIDPDFWSAIALEEAFDIPFIPSTALDPPEVFDVLRAAFREQYWLDTDQALEILAALPVRAALRKNRVRNHVLEQALRYLRAFWLQHGTGKWTRGHLGQPEISRAPMTQNFLSGECERFVADALLGSGISFQWKALNSAWVSLDGRLRASDRNE